MTDPCRRRKGSFLFATQKVVVGTLRTSRDVRLESAMWGKADIGDSNIAALHRPAGRVQIGQRSKPSSCAPAARAMPRGPGDPGNPGRTKKRPQRSES